MNWMIFDSQAEAQAYADAQAATLPLGPDDVTSAWDAPRALTDGRWLVQAHEGGMTWQSDWELVNQGNGK